MVPPKKWNRITYRITSRGFGRCLLAICPPHLVVQDLPLDQIAEESCFQVAVRFITLGGGRSVLWIGHMATVLVKKHPTTSSGTVDIG